MLANTITLWTHEKLKGVIKFTVTQYLYIEICWLDTYMSLAKDLVHLCYVAVT